MCVWSSSTSGQPPCLVLGAWYTLAALPPHGHSCLSKTLECRTSRRKRDSATVGQADGTTSGYSNTLVVQHHPGLKTQARAPPPPKKKQLQTAETLNQARAQAVKQAIKQAPPVCRSVAAAPFGPPACCPAGPSNHPALPHATVCRSGEQLGSVVSRMCVCVCCRCPTPWRCGCGVMHEMLYPRAGGRNKPPRVYVLMEKRGRRVSSLKQAHRAHRRKSSLLE